MGSYDHHAKYKGVFPDLLLNTFFIRVPPLNLFKFSLSKGETLIKKMCFIEGPETQLDILRGGHRNPYQLENAVKRGGTVFCLYHLG